MKIIANEKLIRRNTRIGQFTTFGSLAILALGFILSLRWSTDPAALQSSAQVGLIWGTLLTGFILSQVGIYFGNRWTRRPRPDEALDQALKGMDDRYSVYHYLPPVGHLLVGPAGVWVLEPFYQMGKIVYDKEKKRWRQKSKGFLQNYLRLFGQEGLSGPDLQAQMGIEKVQRFLEKKLPESEVPAIQAVLVFISDKVELTADDSPIPAMLAKDLKEYLRKTTKGKALTPEKAKVIQEALST